MVFVVVKAAAGATPPEPRARCVADESTRATLRGTFFRPAQIIVVCSSLARRANKNCWVQRYNSHLPLSGILTAWPGHPEILPTGYWAALRALQLSIVQRDSERVAQSAAQRESKTSSPALFSVKKIKTHGPHHSESRVCRCIQFPTAADISWEKEYPCSKRIFLRASLARAMRDFTVPTSTPSSSDISIYEKPSISRKIRICR